MFATYSKKTEVMTTPKKKDIPVPCDPTAFSRELGQIKSDALTVRTVGPVLEEMLKEQPDDAGLKSLMESASSLASKTNSQFEKWKHKTSTCKVV